MNGYLRNICAHITSWGRSHYASTRLTSRRGSVFLDHLKKVRASTRLTRQWGRSFGIGFGKMSVGFNDSLSVSMLQFKRLYKLRIKIWNQSWPVRSCCDFCFYCNFMLSPETVRGTRCREYCWAMGRSRNWRRINTLGNQKSCRLGRYRSSV